MQQITYLNIHKNVLEKLEIGNTSLASGDFSSSGSSTSRLRSPKLSMNNECILSSDFVSFRNLGSTDEISFGGREEKK